MTTTDEQWLPLGMEEDEVAVYTALRKDVPPWLESSLWAWIDHLFTFYTQTIYNNHFRVELAHKCERALRLTIPHDGKTNLVEGLRGVRYAVSGSPTLPWRLVDFLISDKSPAADVVKSLDSMLLEAGSGWKVGSRSGKVGLVRRLPEGVEAAAGDAFQQPNAGKRLAAAWEAAFGINPDPTKAYSMAVKAVEDASIPVVCPNDTSATLGKVIGQVNAGTWKLPHLREDKSAPTHDVLVGMMRTLWTGQHDRHGGPSTVSVPAVTQDEAESAVMLAVTLVGWFETGKVQQ
jgi:hypothetical protein